MQLQENKDIISIDSIPETEDMVLVAHSLSRALANTYALYLKTQNYHWNITGANFIALHKLFEEQYLELADSIDVIAERIRTLGYFPPASFKAFLDITDLKEDEFDTKPEVILKNLINANEICIKSYIALKRLSEQKDDVSADLMVSRIGVLQKNVWMLRSFLSDS